ncbi:Bicyclomycin resistance protein [Roseivivax jejudonensis]|uniref:Bicyclomycin resistance protein n=1 Tax=Roseivivax jejudonensis TaxID=1529041 RepID=A0A1X6YRS7_9RHOB|nr:multidrug effflux MFS transporter [Roseivivax jejudonensis]SLN28635.1 Bicyclomycin resistance protein [Roseivivax jejudonensis]
MSSLPIRRTELVALIAMMFATIAFSIDSMLPALPEIAEALTPDNVNAAQLILTVFVLGMGVGTFFTGPLSDAYGRKPMVLGGAALYCVAAAIAAQAQTLEVLLAARLVQGLGAAGPRVVALAIIRDLVSGREMARIMSFVMIVFTLVPALAPSLGALIIAFAGWRGVFGAFVLFSVISALWMWVRLPETHPPEMRRPFRPGAIAAAAREMASYPMVRLSIVVQALTFGMMFSMLSTVQPVYDVTFGRGDEFPFWFGAVAICAGSASFLNAVIVVRVGMRRIVTAILAVQLAMSGTMVALSLAPLPETLYFAAFVAWQGTVFFMAGLCIGNLNALAMEPLGHIAGLAASLIGAIATVAAVLLAIPVGLMFDGTPLPLAAAMSVEAAIALILMLQMRHMSHTVPASA